MAGSGAAALRPGALLSVEHLVVEYRTAGGQKVQAVSDVSLDVLPGETVALVGESGCGKSTTAKAIASFVRPSSGRVVFEDRDLLQLRREELRQTRVRLQMIFQDPISSLHPLRTIESIVGEGLRTWHRGTRDDQRERVRSLMDSVGLAYAPELKRRRTQLSGGQCQRVSIARALSLDPVMLVSDEPVSALDVSVQAQILNLLTDLREEYGLAMLFISHDLGVVRHISNRVVVMYLGKVCEVADVDDLYSAPAHHYTARLLEAAPDAVAAPDRPPTPRPDGPSEIPSPMAPPSGCRFRTRCPAATDRCADEEPEVREVRPGHFVACHFPLHGGGAVHRGTDEDRAAVNP